MTAHNESEMHNEYGMERGIFKGEKNSTKNQFEVCSMNMLRESLLFPGHYNQTLAVCICWLRSCQCSSNVKEIFNKRN